MQNHLWCPTTLAVKGLMMMMIRAQGREVIYQLCVLFLYVCVRTVLAFSYKYCSCCIPVSDLFWLCFCVQLGYELVILSTLHTVDLFLRGHLGRFNALHVDT